MQVLKPYKRKLDGGIMEFEVVDVNVHVHIVIDFTTVHTRILGVYLNRDDAESHVDNLIKKTSGNRINYAVIKQTVRGL